MLKVLKSILHHSQHGGRTEAIGELTEAHVPIPSSDIRTLPDQSSPAESVGSRGESISQ
jgi:hypothetical protein